MSEGEEKAYCKPRQVRDQTDGKSDEIEKVKSNDKLTSKMENEHVSQNADFPYVSVLKTSRP